jgi:hypothetical protein
MSNATHLDVFVVLHGLERDLAHRVAERIIDFTESASAQAVFDREPI